MAKQAKKTEKTTSSTKTVLTLPKKMKVTETMREIEKTGEEAVNMHREDMKEPANNVNEVTAEAADIASRNIHRWNEFSSMAPDILRNIGSEMTENYQRSFLNCVEISREAFRCRSVADIADFQSKALQRLMEGYFESSTRLSNILFRGCAKTFEPLSDRTIPSAAQARRRSAA